MGVSKVVLGYETLIDLTNDTVSENTLLAGETAHNAAGEEIQGGVVVVPTYFGTKEAIETAIAAGEIPDGSLVNITDDEEQSSFQKQINDLDSSLEALLEHINYTGTRNGSGIVGNFVQGYGCNVTFPLDRADLRKITLNAVAVYGTSTVPTYSFTNATTDGFTLTFNEDLSGKRISVFYTAPLK